MPEQINGWLAQGGGALASGVAALTHGGVLGGILLLVIVLAIAVKTAGPELREWVVLFRREDGKNPEAIAGPPAGADDLPDAA